MTASEQERLAVLETQMKAVLEQNREAAEDRKHMKEVMDRVDRMLSTGKAFRLGLLTALPLGGGGVGAALVKFFGSGGPTGTH